ncbi:MAG: hypothetical protein QW620_06185 [Thermoplasmata archaeon]
MKTVCIVSCGKMKIWDKNPNAGKTRAEEAYIGVPTKSSIKYAKKFHPDDCSSSLQNTDSCVQMI